LVNNYQVDALTQTPHLTTPRFNWSSAPPKNSILPIIEVEFRVLEDRSSTLKSQHSLVSNIRG
jgi:hypothetical protein